MIQLKVDSHDYPLSPMTRLLSKKMLSPLCGIVQEVGFLRRSSRAPRIVSTGSELTGVHVLLNKPDPGYGGYHVGAAGTSLNDALIKTFGESIERYAQLVAELSGRFSSRFMNHSQLIATEYEGVLAKSKLQLFTEHQYKQPNFPLQPYVDQPLDWIKLPSLVNSRSCWVPTQLIWVGYQVKHAQGEPWVSPAVTTGTAVHSDKIKAILNAVLELIQIDSAMGHWYSSQMAKRIAFDNRTLALEKILVRQSHFSHQHFSFHWLANPDLAGFSVACVYRNQENIPKVAIGLGSDTSLQRAMYKAYLEAIGVIGFSRMIVFQKKQTYPVEPYFYDLDANVGYYAMGNRNSFIQEKFPLNHTINALDLPPDIAGNEAKQLYTLINSFKESNKELLFCDLTCIEAADLNVVVPRVWSPDTLSLCLPSAPWINHPRYLSYGGFTHEFPHPYP